MNIFVYCCCLPCIILVIRHVLQKKFWPMIICLDDSYTYHEYIGYLLLGGGGHPDGQAPRLDGGDYFARRVGYQHNSNRQKSCIQIYREIIISFFSPHYLFDFLISYNHFFSRRFKSKNALLWPWKRPLSKICIIYVYENDIY